MPQRRKRVSLLARVGPEEDRAKWKEFHAFLEDRAKKQDALFISYFKSPRQHLDIKLRPVTERDLALPSPPGVNRQEILSAIRGGVAAVNLDFRESSLFHSIVEAFARADYPEKLELTRDGLYRLMGAETVETADGRIRWAAGRAFWRLRDKYDSVLMGLSRKSWPFILRMKTGENKAGDPVYRVVVTYAPIIHVAAVSDKVEGRELLKVGPADLPPERFSHYEIILTRAALGEIDSYFAMLPSGLGRQISEHHRAIGQRATVQEFNFIEFLYQQSRETIEINPLKLAEKLKIEAAKLKGRRAAMRDKRVRAALRRCYKTAHALGYVLAVEEDQPAASGGKKDVIRLNPVRFQYLRQGRLLRRTLPQAGGQDPGAAPEDGEE